MLRATRRGLHHRAARAPVCSALHPSTLQTSLPRLHVATDCHTSQARGLSSTPASWISNSDPKLNFSVNAESSTAKEGEADESNESAIEGDTALESTDLLDVYKSLVARGIMQWDVEQARCVIELRNLLETLQDYSPPVDLLRRLSPDAPMLARQAAKSKASWWTTLTSRVNPKSKSGLMLDDDTSESTTQLDRGEGWRERALVRVLSGEEELADLDTPKGILLIGPPGTGKSHLMSLFFSLIPTTRKARHHYHPFLLSLYQAVWRRTQARMGSVTPDVREENMDLAAEKGWRAIFAGGAYDSGGDKAEAEQGRRIAKRSGDEDRESIAFGIARDMMLQYHILYFDELQLVDASSASLLRDILSWYWRLGGVIVATSNRLPDDLYHHGVQAERMRTFLEALKARCTIHELNGGQDYRLRADNPEMPSHERTWFLQGNRVGFEAQVEKITAGQKGEPTSVNVYGRRVIVPWHAGKTARFKFEDLCDQALGTADYITLASRFETFIIDDVPYLYLKHKNQARRLINLVDALYESRCKVVISAEAPAKDIFFPDALLEHDEDSNDSIMAQESVSEALNPQARPNVSSYAPPPTSEGEGDAARIFRRRDKPAHPSEEISAAFKTLSIFTGEDERFAYKRAVSRLIEMSTSPTYASEPWQPLNASARRWEEVALSRPPPPPDYLLKQAKPSTPSNPNPATDVNATRRTLSSLKAGESRESDFADEAGYSRANGVPKTDDIHAKGPPVIPETHMWGLHRWNEPPKGSRSGGKDRGFHTLSGPRKNNSATTATRRQVALESQTDTSSRIGAKIRLRKMQWDTAFPAVQQVRANQRVNNHLFAIRAIPADKVPWRSSSPFPRPKRSIDATAPIDFSIISSIKTLSKSAVLRNRVRSRFKEAVRLASLDHPGLLRPDQAYMASLYPPIYHEPINSLKEQIILALSTKEPKRPPFGSGQQRSKHRRA